MSDPNSFVNFSDYLGLNEGVGDAMRQRLEANYKGPSENDIKGYANAELVGIDNGDVGTYQTNKDAVRTGTATYADFLGGMADPAKRQALLEKAYGGNVNSFDSALAGAGHDDARDAHDKIMNLSNYTDKQGNEADATKSRYDIAKQKADEYAAGADARNKSAWDKQTSAAAAKVEADRRRDVLTWLRQGNNISSWDDTSTQAQDAMVKLQGSQYDQASAAHGGKRFREGGVDENGNDRGYGWY